ncbi:hypothetical protein BpHYR1_022903 [Brachionus plicatilis]|uniref:Uncharacterized protein n=1 Tax=Brachionus plicatilis TaxID=10195 RepID=A0A3M7P380_BRAPC|nr:hypothetical protein BpHYR1_022903 [Brachionus plicatilis]
MCRRIEWIFMTSIEMSFLKFHTEFPCIHIFNFYSIGIASMTRPCLQGDCCKRNKPVVAGIKSASFSKGVTSAKIVKISAAFLIKYRWIPSILGNFLGFSLFVEQKIISES